MDLYKNPKFEIVFPEYIEEVNISNIAIANSENAFEIEDSSISVDFKVKPTSGDEANYRVVVTRGVKPDTTLKTLKINNNGRSRRL